MKKTIIFGLFFLSLFLGACAGEKSQGEPEKTTGDSTEQKSSEGGSFQKTTGKK